MKILIIIPARAGSIRLKDKNLKKINGVSLIKNTILFAKKISNVTDILVTSDSKKINDISKKEKIKFVVTRPKKLSMRSTPSALTVIHAIKWYEKNYTKIDSILLLQPTSPFRSLTTYKKCLKAFIKTKRPVISVHKDQEKTSDGNIYLISKSDLIKKKSFLEGISVKIKSLTLKESIDIDTMKDLKIAREFSKV